MHGDQLHLPPKPSEWQHSLRFILLAVVLHLAVLALPPNLFSTRTEITPEAITVKLTAPAPKLTPQPTAEPSVAPGKQARREKTPPQPRPILAMAPSAIAPAPSFVVAPPPAPIASVAEPAPPAMSAARYDAAYLNNPPPDYPRMSRRLGEEGKVLLRVHVRADGTAATVDLEKGSNFDRLDEAARRAVTRWRFVPAKRGDEAVEASVIVPIIFRLDS